MTGEDGQDRGADRTRPQLLEPTCAEHPSRRRGAARAVGPLVLVSAVALLVVALVGAISTLRAPLPDSALPATAEAAATSTTASSPRSAASSGSATAEAPSGSRQDGTRGATATGATAGTPSATSAGSGPSATSAGSATSASSVTSGPGGTHNDAAASAAHELSQIAAEHDNRPQGQVYAVLFDLAEGTENAHLTTDAGSSTWRAEDILGLYRQRASAWPGALLEARTEGAKTTWRLTVSNPQWRTAAQAQKWCDTSFAQYAGEAKTSRCRVPQG